MPAKYKDLSRPRWTLVWYFIFTLTFLVFCLLPYLQAEFLTLIYAEKIPIKEFCQKARPFISLTQAKIISLEKQRKRMQIYCLYQNPEENLRLTLVKESKLWRVILIERLNRERNLYWPIYL